MTAMSPEYSNAVRLHQAGQLTEAVPWYQAALAREPENVDVLHLFGVLRHQTGQPAAALDLIEHALRRRPEFAEAWSNLGLVLRQLDRHDQALDALRTAVRQAPQLATAQANLGKLLLDRGHLEEALSPCLEAVRLVPHVAAVHENLGEVYCRLGRNADAVAAYRQALDLSPENVRLLEALAYLHMMEGDFPAAIACGERLVALEPRRADWHNHLGMAWQQEGWLDEAARCYRRALELRPDHELALLNQGSVHGAFGDLAAAEAFYRRARANQPNAAAPVAELATLLRDRLPDADRQAVVDLLQTPALADEARLALLFGLAQVLDARGDFREAADCLRQAHSLGLAVKRRQGRLYDPEEFHAHVTQLTQTFTPELFHRLARAGDITRQPVFVFGLPRSGTSLVEQVLASHSQVHGAGELALARQVIDAAAPALLGPSEALRGTLKRMGRDYLGRLQAILERDRPGGFAGRVVDKMPDNYLYLGVLALMLPRATFIHVRRDLRDVAVSCWLTRFTNLRWTSDLGHLAGRIRDYQRLMRHWAAVLPVPVHEVVYERLVNDFDAEARRLVVACGLDWESACAEFHKTRRVVATASAGQVRQPLYRQAVGRWKNYEPYLAELFAALAEP
jgi:tetratricopeptide (TPR) repeat protein